MWALFSYGYIVLGYYFVVLDSNNARSLQQALRPLILRSYSYVWQVYLFCTTKTELIEVQVIRNRIHDSWLRNNFQFFK
jgi:hypothetical protein